MFKRISSLLTSLISTLGSRPARSFVILLVLLFTLIALGHFFRTPKEMERESATEAKTTAVFDLSTDTAYVTLPAEAQKESVIHITALAPGIVSSILVSPGRPVASGQTLLLLTDDYRSGKSNIRKRLAEESDRLTQELAKIEKRITELEEKKIKQDATLTDKAEDLELARLKKDRAERKSSITQSTLSRELSNIEDAVFKPKTFSAGKIESISVKRGDFVSAGDILATLSTPQKTTTLEVFLDPKTARLLDTTKEARLLLGSDTISLRPTYVSQSENERGLFPVLFTLSEENENRIIDGQFLEIALPLKKNDGAIALIPIDAISQDDASAWVLVETNGKAIAKPVTLGTIHGSFALILSGLSQNDRVILNRAVLSDDEVSIK